LRQRIQFLATAVAIAGAAGDWGREIFFLRERPKMLSRPKDDRCSAIAEFTDNVSIFAHTLDPNRFVREKPCAAKSGTVGGNVTATVGEHPSGAITESAHGQAWAKQVDVESELKSLTRPTSRCPETKFLGQTSDGKYRGGRNEASGLPLQVSASPLNPLEQC
jgi:hypothetical protein